MNTIKNKHILVVGDVMLDHYVYGSCNRISPEAPVPVVAVEQDVYNPGGAANVARNLVRLGLQPLLYGNIGADAAGQRLKELLDQHQIQHRLSEANKPTTQKIRIISGGQQLLRMDREDASFNAADDGQNLPDLSDMKGNYTILSDYNKGMCSRALCQSFIQSEGRVLVDPKGTSWDKYQGCHLLTPNLKEVQDVLGKAVPNTDDAVAKAAHQIKDNVHCDHLLITRSEQGMTLLTKEGTIHHLKTKPVAVYDVSGAGDTVIAVMAYALMKGHDVLGAAQMANAAASYVVTQPGVYAIGEEELEKCIH